MATIRSDLQLDDEQKARVLEEVRRRGFSCGGCSSEDFEVGGALYLGFLFLNEPLDSYMVALTCTAPDCPDPRTGIKLSEGQFTDEAQGG